MKLQIFKLAILISIILLSCKSIIYKESNQHLNNFLDCLNTKEEIRGKRYSKEGNHFQIELPKHWHVKTDFENGISGSDTLAKLEDYDLIGITEFKNEGFDFEEEYLKLIESLKREGKVGSMDGKVRILDEGETIISGNEAKWILVEDEQIQEMLGTHARINYFFQVKGSNNYYIIYNESYGKDKMENLCELKKITNTFRYTE